MQLIHSLDFISLLINLSGNLSYTNNIMQAISWKFYRPGMSTCIVTHTDRLLFLFYFYSLGQLFDNRPSPPTPTRKGMKPRKGMKEENKKNMRDHLKD